jgi:nicotinamidase-related amidase
VSEHYVLLVVDAQNDFMPAGALAVPRGDEVVPVINALAGRFANVVITQDTHPRAHLVRPGRLSLRGLLGARRVPVCRLWPGRGDSRWSGGIGFGF